MHSLAHETPDLPDHLMNLLTQELEYWDDCSGVLEKDLLRLSLLRRVAHKLHRLRSQALAYGQRAEVQKMKSWEEHLERLRHLPSLNLTREELFRTQSQCWSIPAKKPFIPESLFSQIHRENLLAKDRQWEAALAAEAARLHWQFWKLTTWLVIDAIESWLEQLTQTLWPHSLVLLMGNAPALPEAPEHLWQGEWILLVHPHYQHPLELISDFQRWPGAPDSPPTPTHWKLLYPPLGWNQLE